MLNFFICVTLALSGIVHGFSKYSTVPFHDDRYNGPAKIPGRVALAYYDIGGNYHFFDFFGGGPFIERWARDRSLMK